MARPPHVLATDEMEREFADVQIEAYRAASHGWFFWTYSDQADHWDLPTCCGNGWIVPSSLKQHASSERPARAMAPGRVPQCYGEDEFSQLPRGLHSRRDAGFAKDLRVRAEALASATETSVSEASSALMMSSGHSEAALQGLLALAAARRVA